MRDVATGMRSAVSDTALLVIDMINDDEHPDADALASSVETMIEPLRRLVASARGRDDVDLI